MAEKEFKELFGHTKTLSQHGVDENSGGALKWWNTSIAVRQL